MSNELVTDTEIESQNGCLITSVGACTSEDEQTNTNTQPTRKNLSFFGRDLNIRPAQLAAIVLLAVTYLLSASYYSLFAPFLPGEALKKGLNQTQVGIIFGVFELVLIILIPIFGKYVYIIYFLSFK